MTTELLVNRDGEEIRKGRISPALRTAITLIVSEGLTVADAAVRTGYKVHSLTQALKKMGHDPAKDFNDRLIAFMSKQSAAPSTKLKPSEREERAPGS